MINIFAPINPTGYGVHATNIIGELLKITDNISLFPIGKIQYEGKHKELIARAVERGANHYDAKNIGLCLWHGNDMSRFSGNIRIAYTVFVIISALSTSS